MRIVLVDDHALVRAGLRALLEALGEIVVAEAGDGREALDLIARHQPDLAMIDLSMPGLNGFEVAARVPSTSPATRVLVVSMHSEPDYVAHALRSGVAGYILKDGSVDELRLALRAVTRGETFLSPAISRQVVDGYIRGNCDGDPLAELTDRQREILQAIAEGHSMKAIAARLEVSVKTVETHRAQLMERLHIHDLAGLVRFAVRTGVVGP